jgi:hypothetical protein
MEICPSDVEVACDAEIELKDGWQSLPIAFSKLCFLIPTIRAGGQCYYPIACSCRLSQPPGQRYSWLYKCDKKNLTRSLCNALRVGCRHIVCS